MGQWKKMGRDALGRENIEDYVLKRKKVDLASDTHVKLWKED